MKIFNQKGSNPSMSVSGLIRDRIYSQVSDLFLAINKVDGTYSPNKKLKKK